jgi:hypothetical protein
MTQRFKRLSHTLYECKYHIVFCPKYRHRILLILVVLPEPSANYSRTPALHQTQCGASVHEYRGANSSIRGPITK